MRDVWRKVILKRRCDGVRSIRIIEGYLRILRRLRIELRRISRSRISFAIMLNS
jgi:hypothetical protein